MTAIQKLRERAEELHNTGKLKEAIPLYQEMLEKDGNNPESWYAAGIALLAMRDYKGASNFLEHALGIAPTSVSCSYNLGIAYDAQGDYGNAERCYLNAIRHDPYCVLAHVNLGSLCYRAGKPVDGYHHHTEALKPQIVGREERAGRALIALLRKDWRRGYREYEERLQLPNMRALDPMPTVGRAWRGQKLRPDRTILLYHEQGMGDTLMMLRYVERVSSQCPVILMVQPALKRLVQEQNIPGVEQVFVRGEDHPDFYYHCPMMSLPWAFRDEGLEPYWNGAYIKAPEVSEVPKLGTETLKVGVAWTSDSAHQNSKDRNCPFKHFAKLFQVEGITWVNVNVPRPPNTLERVPGEIYEVPINDFHDTAAVVSQLDLLISIDSATAHLAGAMGIKTWLLTPSAPEFRWGLEMDTTPWYPGHKLYRRQSTDAWPEVIERVKTDLTNWRP